MADRTDVDVLESLVSSRRTSLRMDPERVVESEVVERLCAAAVWAPNHHKTWPWRFAAVTGDARARIGEALARHLEAQGEMQAKIDKARRKYVRAPLVLAVASAGDHDERIALENRDAVSAGIQNLLLTATVLGLASFWASGAVLTLPEVREICGFAADDTIVALIYLGYPNGEVPAPERPAPALNWVS